MANKKFKKSSTPPEKDHQLRIKRAPEVSFQAAGMNGLRISIMAGGLGLSLLNFRNRKPTKKCGRCGLRFPEDQPRCAHCGELSEEELGHLKQRIENEHAAHSRLGTAFWVISLVILVMVLIG